MTKEYCGFVCSDVVEKAREIKKELDDFAKYNPKEAQVVLGNVLKALGQDVIVLEDDEVANVSIDVKEKSYEK